MRCIKANRTCRGYEDGASPTIQQYKIQSQFSFTLAALKCTLPRRVPVPGTDILPEDKLPTEVSQAESDLLALRAFFYDYCIVPTNQNLSRGFLSGLEMMACRLGPHSDLVKVCQAVSYATHGKLLNRPRLVNQAKILYQELLGSLAAAIGRQISSRSTETKLIAMLLGLFEVLNVTFIIFPVGFEII
jgi:hypothetical protein